MSPLSGMLAITKLSVVELGERVKHMNVISHSHGYVLRKIAPVKEKEAMQLAQAKFEEALDSSPLNAVTLRNTAVCLGYSLDLVEMLKKFRISVKDCLEIPANFDADSWAPDAREAEINYILWLFSMAEKSNPRDTHTLYQFGEFVMVNCLDFEYGEELLIRALEADASQVPAWDALVFFYRELGRLGEADWFYQARLKVHEKLIKELGSDE